jgi:hypothetical protein
LDIFAISYFPDIQAKPRQDLVYLKNNGGYSFSPLNLGKDISARWITFDIEDIDGNGYNDILLGSLGVYQDSLSLKGNPPNKAHSLLLLKNLGN